MRCARIRFANLSDGADINYMPPMAKSYKRAIALVGAGGICIRAILMHTARAGFDIAPYASVRFQKAAALARPNFSPNAVVTDNYDDLAMTIHWRSLTSTPQPRMCAFGMNRKSAGARQHVLFAKSPLLPDLDAKAKHW